MMVGAYTGVGMMLFARQMDEEVKIALFGDWNYNTFYSVRRLNRILLMHSFQVRAMSVSARGSPLEPDPA